MEGRLFVFCSLLSGQRGPDLPRVEQADNEEVDHLNEEEQAQHKQGLPEYGVLEHV